ncbi:hypothetical protein CR513_56966, partial [Mucuna pruriens]
MPGYGASSSLNLNWLFGLLGLGEKGAPISDHTTNTIHQFILLLLAEDTETNPNANDEVDHEGNPSGVLDHFFESQQGEEEEHPSGELDHYSDGGHHRRAAAPNHDAGRRHGGCAFCGNFTTTRCSRCKAARYW